MATDNEIQVLNFRSKERPWRWLLIPIAVLLIIPFFFIGKGEIKQSDTYIDSTLQYKVASILSDKLTELNARFGQAIVMETETGAVKAMVGLQKNFDDTYVPCDIFAYQQVSGLTRAFSYMAAMETKKVKLTDTVDVKEGIYLVDGMVLKDHNWHRGGYGMITYDKGFIVTSNISVYKAVQKAFPNRPKAYFDALDSLKWGVVGNIEGIPNLKPRIYLSPKDSLWASYNYPFSTIGYNQKIAAIQILASYNAIANNGKMVKPKIYKGETEIMDDSIASSETIKAIQKAMRDNVTIGLGKPGNSDKVKVAGTTGGATVSDNEDDTEGSVYTTYVAEFCGYFPIEKPKYTIIVLINKMGLPSSSGLMAGSVFKEIVDYMVTK